MGTSADALQREVQELREENAALLEALRLAQRGEVDLRGHLSKWNPDATAQGIFTQDWELRYFVLSGTLLKYYSSERDVGIEHPRGVLELQDCHVEVELPVKSSGPFIFQIKDPDDELLLRLSADNLKMAKTWVRTLAAAGLLIQGFERFSGLYHGLKARSVTGLSSESYGSNESSAAGGVGFLQTSTAPVSWGSKLTRALQNISSFRGTRSIDSDVSIVRLGDETAAAAAKKGTATDPGRRLATSAPETHTVLGKPSTHPGTTASHQQQQQQHVLEDAESQDEDRQLQHLKRMSTINRSASVFAGPLARVASSRRWERPDIGDELPSPKQSPAQDSEDETETDQEAQELESALNAAAAAATTGPGTDRIVPPGSTTSAVEGTSTVGQGDKAGTPAAATAEAPSTAPEVPAVPAAVAAAGGSRVGGRGRRQQTMDGASPVHVAAKDSVLTGVDQWSISRHEGLLNLGVVVLVATNIRMIMSNIFTYGLRLRLNKSTVFGAVEVITSSRDDLVTLAAVPGCLLFVAVALLIELLGWRLLTQEKKLLAGLVKKEVPVADIRRQLSAAAVRHEWLMFILNLVNAGGSLLLPCWLVLSNNSTLLAASALTFVSIVTSMKLTTYAHCNTTLRHRKRRQQYRAAAGKPSRSASGAATPQEGLPPAAGDQPSPFALATAAGAAPDPATSFMNTTLGSKNGQNHLSPQREVVYPDNLNPRDLLYFMFAPTLTYQLNYPRIKQRRPRLLMKWCFMLLITGLAMGFMQVQFLLPLMQSSLAPLRELNMLRFTEKLLRLSIPSLVHWLAMFFLIFHLFLNITGELLMFGDRVFYKEWWNAATLADYWKLWNIPVHKWMLRTVFFPLVRRGVGKFWSMLIVFFISAVMHEVAVGVPLRMLKGWAFMGMFMQVPLISLTEAIRKRLKSDSWGNIIFWLSFCVLGQPMCLIFYYHDWLLENMGVQGIAQAAAAGAGAAATAAADALTGGCG